MPARRIKPTPNAVKLHYSYSVRELATCCGVHPHTVRNWQGKGLEPIDKARPALGLVEYRPLKPASGDLCAICETCEGIMHRRVRKADLARIMPCLPVQSRTTRNAYVGAPPLP